MTILDRNLDNAPKTYIDLDDLERQKAEFLKRGGTITMLPPCVTSDRVERPDRTHSKKQKIKIEDGEF